MRSPVLGGLKPVGDRFCPNLVRTSFYVRCQDDIDNNPPQIEISGSGMRRIKSRQNQSDEQLEGLIDINLSPITLFLDFNLEDSSIQDGWTFPPRREQFDNSRILRLNDPGLDLVLHCHMSIDRAMNTVQIDIMIRNESGSNLSVFQDLRFNIRTINCEIFIDPNIPHPQDLTFIIETINTVADLSNNNQLNLIPYGIWDDYRREIDFGPTMEEIEGNPLPAEIQIPEELKEHFKYAIRIVARAMKNMNYTALYRYQYDARNRIYISLIQCWNDNVSRAIVINTPTASGKSEINYDACIVAAIVLKQQFDEVGTVAVISEPIRALTAEQLERIFELIAFINEELSEEKRITLGYFMGTYGVKGIPYQPGPDVNINQVPISKCPFCHNHLHLEFRQAEDREIPICDNCEREFDWIYVTVKETQQFLPNIVIATVDKLCYDEARKLNVHNFFGREYVRCQNCSRVHAVKRSVLNPNFNCYYCHAAVNNSEIHQSQFSIFVFDEAHTFKGSLGSNVSLYTSAELALTRQFINKAPFIISSTATINNSKELLKNLTGVEQDNIYVLPANQNEFSDYFPENTDQYHRKFVFICPNIANRQALPRGILAVKEAWELYRNPDDPERLPQIIFTLKRREAENLGNTIHQKLYDQEPHNIRYRVIHGESLKQEIASVLNQVRNNEVDVVIATLDLIALGIDIPSISVVHFHSMPDDYAKFVQAYGRSSRGREDCGLIFIWLRVNVPPETYFLEHYRDLFLYRNELIPIIPINKWFPESIRKYLPAAAVQYSHYTDRNYSIYNSMVAIRRFSNPDFQRELENFMNNVLENPIYDEDESIARGAIRRGIQNMATHINSQRTQRFKNSEELMKTIIPRSIRNTSNDVIITPTAFRRTMITAHLSEVFREAGFVEDLRDDELDNVE